MAQRVVTELVDDLDGGKAEETVNFAIDGVEYEIDLSKQNASNLRKGLNDYVSKGRRIGGRSKRGTASGPSSTDRSQIQAMREWAKGRGMKVSDRGRVSREVSAAFENAHKR